MPDEIKGWNAVKIFTSKEDKWGNKKIYQNETGEVVFLELLPMKSWPLIYKKFIS